MREAERFKQQGWSIDPDTRFLIFKEGTLEEQIYSKVLGDAKLESVYIRLGLELWGRVGTDDLIDKDFEAIASKLLKFKKQETSVEEVSDESSNSSEEK